MRVEVDDPAVQRQRVQVHPGKRFALQFGLQPFQGARVGAAVQPHIDRVPVAELMRQVQPWEST